MKRTSLAAAVAEIDKQAQQRRDTYSEFEEFGTTFDIHKQPSDLTVQEMGQFFEFMVQRLIPSDLNADTVISSLGPNITKNQIASEMQRLVEPVVIGVHHINFPDQIVIADRLAICAGENYETFKNKYPSELPLVSLSEAAASHDDGSSRGVWLDTLSSYYHPVDAARISATTGNPYMGLDGIGYKRALRYALPQETVTLIANLRQAGTGTTKVVHSTIIGFHEMKGSTPLGERR